VLDCFVASLLAMTSAETRQQALRGPMADIVARHAARRYGGVRGAEMLDDK
jgi:hypothetical protein